MSGINRAFIPALFVLMLVFSFTGCNENPQAISGPEGNETLQKKGRAIAQGDPHVVDVYAAHDHSDHSHSFELETDVLPSGWTTFRFNNPTEYVHFFMIYKAPEGAIQAANKAGQSVLQHWYENITAPFQVEWNLYVTNESDYAGFSDWAFNHLFPAVLDGAPWFVNATVMGGPGFTSGGQTSQTTVHLEPGTYVVECYVKDDEQVFHSANGMLESFEVTGQSSGAPEPKPTVEIDLYNGEYTHGGDGMVIPEKIRPGKHIIAINYEQQDSYGHLLGHNAQLVRFDHGYDPALLDDLGYWINWANIDGLVDTSPMGTTFLGGAMEMTEGSTAYISVVLKPGEYAWIAEVPNPDEEGMLKTFSVPGK